MFLKRIFYFSICCFGIFLMPTLSFAQEVESAALSLEEYSDEFQEHFFEALKQRGIENYDKAIDALLKCKKVDAKPSILDFELGKNFRENKQYNEAETYLLAAVKKSPKNQWYLRELYTLYSRIGNIEDALRTGKKVIKINPRFKENLARLYFRTKEYDKALGLLDDLDASFGRTQSRDSLRFQLNRMKSYQNTESKSNQDKKMNAAVSGTKKDIDSFLERLERLQDKNDFKEMLLKSSAGLSLYPSQPQLYFFNGVALSRQGDYRKAIFSLESGLDYIVDDPRLEAEFYTELSNAYKEINDSRNARQYLRKAQKAKKKIQ